MSGQWFGNRCQSDAATAADIRPRPIALWVVAKVEEAPTRPKEMLECRQGIGSGIGQHHIGCFKHHQWPMACDGLLEPTQNLDLESFGIEFDDIHPLQPQFSDDGIPPPDGKRRGEAV